ncbi:MAG: 6,7-dimethyl-8-ribityllumazine synthase [Marinicellaceae bacterium]
MKKNNIAIVIAPFYTHITEGLLQGATKFFDNKDYQYKEFEVAGALEIPLACQLIAQSEKFQGIIALGAVIRGETPHFDHVCEQSSRGIMDVSLKYSTPIGNGIITIENESQALARSNNDEKNKGAEAAAAVLGLIELQSLL